MVDICKNCDVRDMEHCNYCDYQNDELFKEVEERISVGL